jgi:hypothetical protein
MESYYTYEQRKIAAWRPRKARARDFVNFRKTYSCIARAALPLGFDSLPSLSDVGTCSFRWILPFWYFCFLLGDKARLALSPKRKQKYQNGNIHRKLKVPTSTILLRSKVQYRMNHDGTWIWNWPKFRIILQCRAATAGHGLGHGLRWPEVAAWGQAKARPRVRNPRPRKRLEAVMAWGHARPGHRPGHMFMNWPSQYIWTNLVLIAYYRSLYSDSVPVFFKLAAKNTVCSLASTTAVDLNLVLEY